MIKMKLIETMQHNKLLEVNLDKCILEISLNRIDVFNALNHEFIQELINIFSSAANNSAAPANSLVSDSGI